MPSPKWTKEIIDDLSDRVRKHNEQVAEEGQRVRLTDLKKRYANGYRGDDETACAAAAIANVERHLERLEKLAKASFDSDKHPRGTKGEFAAKGKAAPAAVPVRIVLPDPDQHAQLQRDDPSYAALTTDVLPETRGELAGHTARVAGSLALGVGGVISLAHSPNGVIGRFIRNAAGFLAEKTVFPASTAVYAASKLGHMAAEPIARRMGRKLRTDHASARKASNFTFKAARKVGEVAADVFNHGSHFLINAGVDAGRARLPRHGKALSIGGIGGVTGLIINSGIKDTPIDPQKYGYGYDQTHHRTVRKMAADNAELLDAIVADVLAKVQTEGVLAKFGGGLWSTAGRHLLTGAAALGGGAAAAGATEAVHAITGARRGNPHHDARGRFTSSANAATGGLTLAGAAAAGIGAYAALRGHNFRRFAEAITNAGERISEEVNQIHSPRGYGKVADMIANRDHTVRNRMDADKKHLAEIARIDAFAGSHELHFKTRIRAEVNNKLATFLSQVNEFRVPQKGVPPSQWPTIADIRKDAGPLKADVKAFNTVLDSVDTVSAKDFDDAIKGMTPEGQETARYWLTTRQTAMDKVDTDIASHQGKIEKAIAAVDQAEQAKEKTRLGVTDARALIDRATTEPEKEAAHQTYLDAMQAHTAANDGVKKAEKARDNLRNAPSGVISPVTNQPIPPATDAEMMQFRTASRAQAKSRAEKVTDAEIERARQAQSEAAVKRGHRILAAQAAVGRRAGAIPAHAARGGTELAALRQYGRKLKTRLSDALREQTSSKKALNDLALVERGKLPKGMKPEDAAELRTRADKLKQDLADAARKVSSIRSQIGANEFRIAQKAQAFEKRVTSGPEKGAKRMPDRTYQAIMRDLSRATVGAREPIEAFIASPTAERLAAFAKAGAAHAIGMADTAYKGFVDLARHALFRKTGEGENASWSLDPAKALLQGAVFTAAAEGGRDVYSFARDQVRSALAGQESKTKFPKSVKIERQIDPLTGAGFLGISAPDPENKDDRILLWGQRFKDSTAAPETLHPGARVSALRARLGGGGPGSPGGLRAPFISADARDIANLPQDKRKKISDALATMRDRMHAVQVEDGHALKFRPNSDETKQGESDILAQHVRENFLKSGSPSNARLYFDALDTILSSNQSPILKQKQAFQLLTGYNTNGQKKGNGGVFKAGDDSGFGEQSKSEVLDALKGEVDRVMEHMAPRDDRQKTNLVRAIGVVGKTKGVADEDLKPLFDQIRGNPTELPFSDTEHVKPTIIQAEPAPGQRKRRITPETDVPHELPEGWDQKDLREASYARAEALAPKLGITKPEKLADLATMMEFLGHTVNYTHALPMAESLQAAHDAIAAVSEGGRPNRDLARDAVSNSEPHAFLGALNEHADRIDAAYRRRRNGVEKVCLLDDFEALLKAGFGDSIGEEEGQDGARIARETLDEGADRAGRGAVGEQGSRRASNYTPTKIASDVGGLVASEGAGYLAGEGAKLVIGKLFPEVSGAANVLSALRQGYASGGAQAGAQAALKAARTMVIKHGIPAAAGTAASLPAFFAGSAAGNAAARAGYHAAGLRAPPNTPVQLTPGEQAGEGIGNVVGAIAGGALGGAGPLSIATGAAGGYLGGVVGRNAADVFSAISRHFGGYDQNKVAAIGARVNSMAPRRVSPMPAPTHSMGASTGLKRGDPYHDKAGRFSSQGTS